MEALGCVKCGTGRGSTDNIRMPLRTNPLDMLLTALAGWLPMLGGMTLLAMVLITPEWLGWRELVWQRDVLNLQSERLETQRASYTQFHDALAADDPVLLERLAFTQLRYKPAGKRLMNDLWAVAGPGDAAAYDASGRAFEATTAHGQVYGSSEVIESWLTAPQPVVGRDILPLRVINSRLTRLTTGPSRYVLLTVALLCLVAGLLPNEPESDTDEARSAGGKGPMPGKPGPTLRTDTRLSFIRAYRRGA